MSGIEIKYDRNTSKTGNLYFETHEKTDENLNNWTESGILRYDNTWLWCIGDETKLYLISKKQLRAIYERNCNTDTKRPECFVSRETKTSKGFTLSNEYVTKHLAAKIIHCKPFNL
jgi:hypothetical protein